MDYKKQTKEVKQIILDLATEYDFAEYSTIDEIDYKFWEDVGEKEIAINLAQKIDVLNRALAKAKDEIKALNLLAVSSPVCPIGKLNGETCYLRGVNGCVGCPHLKGK